jgi:hypothetical protein
MIDWLNALGGISALVQRPNIDARHATEPSTTGSLACNLLVLQLKVRWSG